jgi:hypothetical protein
VCFLVAIVLSIPEAFPQVAQAARRLYNTPGQHLSLGQVVELNKRFLEGYNHFKNEPRIVALRENVLKYNRMLRDLGIRDHQVWDKRPLFSLFLLAQSFVGSTCAEGFLEDPRSTSLSLGFAHIMDCSCSSRRSHQRADLSGRFYHIKAQSERFVVVIPSVHSTELQTQKLSLHPTSRFKRVTWWLRGRYSSRSALLRFSMASTRLSLQLSPRRRVPVFSGGS